MADPERLRLPSISFCTTTKDRFEHLRQTFEVNILENQSYPNCEFVLLNYDCPDQRTEQWVESVIAPYIELGRVTYYKIPERDQFRYSHSRNLAFRLATGDILCNIDADNFAGCGFAIYVSAVVIREKTFLRGPTDGRGLGGRLCVWKHDWLRVDGYDERFRGWGEEDTDLSARLRLLGLRQESIVNLSFMRSIQHSDEFRTRHTADVDKKVSRRRNHLISEVSLENRTLKPNGGRFGNGLVKKNFSEWIEV